MLIENFLCAGHYSKDFLYSLIYSFLKSYYFYFTVRGTETQSLETL